MEERREWRKVNRYKVTLTQVEREQLTRLTHSGKKGARKFGYARALLLCDEGEYGERWKVCDVAEALGVSSRTIEHLKERFVEEGLEAALERKRPEKPRAVTFGGEFEAKLIALACSEAPEGRVRWTLELLSEKLVELKIVESVSLMTVQRTLKKTKCVLI
jgi:transposase